MPALLMGEAMRRHDATMQAAIESNGGYVFKTIGDAFCAAFSRVDQAIAAALAAQRALAEADFSEVEGYCVRMALHVERARNATATHSARWSIEQ